MGGFCLLLLKECLGGTAALGLAEGIREGTRGWVGFGLWWDY
jgi:hypothetical protein